MTENTPFVGRITNITEPRTGEGAKGPWASLNFMVEESNPRNPEYPQRAVFSFFKNGENIKYATDFATYNKIGDEVSVAYSHSGREYQKDGKTGMIASLSAFKITKVESVNQDVPAGGLEEAFNQIEDINPEDIPF